MVLPSASRTGQEPAYGKCSASRRRYSETTFATRCEELSRCWARSVFQYSPPKTRVRHALKAMNVPTTLVVYPDEGHMFVKPADDRDYNLRTLEWFEEWFRKAGAH